MFQTKQLSGSSVDRIGGDCSVLAVCLCSTKPKVIKGRVLHKRRIRRRDVLSKNPTSMWVYDASNECRTSPRTGVFNAVAVK